MKALPSSPSSSPSSSSLFSLSDGCSIKPIPCKSLRAPASSSMPPAHRRLSSIVQFSRDYEEEVRILLPPPPPPPVQPAEQEPPEGWTKKERREPPVRPLYLALSNCYFERRRREDAEEEAELNRQFRLHQLMNRVQFSPPVHFTILAEEARSKYEQEVANILADLPSSPSSSSTTSTPLDLTCDERFVF
jgi:hypothetical protein